MRWVELLFSDSALLGYDYCAQRQNCKSCNYSVNGVIAGLCRLAGCGDGLALCDYQTTVLTYGVAGVTVFGLGSILLTYNIGVLQVLAVAVEDTVFGNVSLVGVVGPSELGYPVFIVAATVAFAVVVKVTDGSSMLHQRAGSCHCRWTGSRSLRMP